MVVDEEIGQPAVKHFEKRAGLRCVGFHVIAVEIVVSAVAAPSYDFGAVLVDAVPRGAALVAVEVVNGDEDENYVIEQRGVGFGNDEVAQQRQAGVFTVHFAGVDGVLDEENGASRRVNGGGVEDAVSRSDDDFQVAPFAGLAEVLDAYLARSGRGDPLEVRDSLGVVGSGAVVGNLGGCAPVGGLS